MTLNAGGDREGDEGWALAGGARACAACGAQPRREGARFCETCGRGLEEEYFPADSLRASYSFERRPAREARRRTAQARRPARAARPRPGAEFRFGKNENSAASTGLAFVTYALVPYLGILFCPGALVMGGLGLWRARRAPLAEARRPALLALLLGLCVLCAQLLLWWILYKVPEWTRGGGF